MSAKKVVRKTRRTSMKAKAPSFYDKIEGTIIGQPIVIANKTFLASLGLMAAVRSDFVKKVDELAKDGEVVRDEYQASFEKMRDDFVGRINDRRELAGKRARGFVRTITDSFPLATDDDVQELEQKIEKKLDKVLVEVAK